MSEQYRFRIILCVASLTAVTFFKCMEAPRITRRTSPEKEVYIKEKLRYTLVAEHDKRNNRYHVAKHWDQDHITEKEDHYVAFKKLKTSFNNGQEDQPHDDNNLTVED